MRASKLVLYDLEWQILRVSLLAAHNSYGGWGSLEGTRTNIKKLRDYIDAALDEQDKFNRLYRANNLLAGVRLGYAQQSSDKFQNSQESYEVSVYQQIVSNDVYKMKVAGFVPVPPTEEQLIAALTMPDTDEIFSYSYNIKRVWHDLYNRYERHKDKAHRTREELIWFLNLITKYRNTLGMVLIMPEVVDNASN